MASVVFQSIVVVPRQIQESLKIRPGRRWEFVRLSSGLLMVRVMTADQAFGSLRGTPVISGGAKPWGPAKRGLVDVGDDVFQRPMPTEKRTRFSQANTPFCFGIAVAGDGGAHGVHVAAALTTIAGGNTLVWLRPWPKLTMPP